MRARLENEDGSFLAEVEAPDGSDFIRFGERFFVHTDAAWIAVQVYAAPTEGALVVEP